MEVHQLKYFVELAESGNFTRAAEACFVTQPTLSHQIRKLEEELGDDLFLRSSSSARLTPLGEKIHPHVLQILNEIRTIQNIAGEFHQLLQGEIRIGAIPTIAPYLIPQLVGGFIANHSHLHVGFSEEVTQTLLTQLHEGKIDFALASPPFDEKNLILQELPEDELLVTCPTNHHLLKTGVITVEDLRNYPLVLMQEAHCLSQQALQVCNQYGGTPAQVSIRSSQLETVQALVELGMGISFTPAMAIPYLSKRKVTHRRLGKKGVFRRIALVRSARHPITHAMQAFIKHIESQYTTNK
jgi:LysR family hydrogen peroxide-inducible transcriptional activator